MATTGEDLNPRERITFSALRGINPHNQRVKKSPQRVGANLFLQTNLTRVSRHQNENIYYSLIIGCTLHRGHWWDARVSSPCIPWLF